MTLAATSSIRAATEARHVGLLGLGTATPAGMPQSKAEAFTEPLCCSNEQQSQFLARVYAHSGVQSRGSVLVDAGDAEYRRSRAFFRQRESDADRGPTTRQRMELYERYAPGLAERAARDAMADAGLDTAKITHLLPVSCTGFFSPGLDVELIRRLPLSPGVTRLQVGFMGCHGAFNALSAARRIVLAQPSAVVLVVCVELCSLHLAYGFDPQRIVANALFADGAAAAVIGAADRDAANGAAACVDLLASSTMLIAESLDAMTWRIGDHGFEMTLSPRVPALVREQVPGWLIPWLDRENIPLADIAAMAIHPGGPRVLSAVVEGLGLPESFAAPSREVLARHGNMSSGTVLFVLQDLLRSGRRGKCLALGFGPGLTAESLLLELL